MSTKRIRKDVGDERVDAVTKTARQALKKYRQATLPIHKKSKKKNSNMSPPTFTSQTKFQKSRKRHRQTQDFSREPDVSGPADKSNPEYVYFCAAWDEPISQEKFQEGLDSIQGTKDWLENQRKLEKWGLKVNSFSGSGVANHYGVGYRSTKHNVKSSACKASREMVYGSNFKSNPMTKWGNGGEPWAEKAFYEYMLTYFGQVEEETGDEVVDIECKNYGVWIHKDRPRFRYSPDGALIWTLRRKDGSIYQERDLIEYKCPWGLRDRRDGFCTDDGYKAHPIKKCEHRSYPMKDYYMPQCQWGMYIGKKMGLLTRRRCHFVVWWPGYCPRGEEKAWPHHQVATTANGTSTTVMGRSGSFQWTVVDFEPEYTAKLIQATEKSWQKHVLPELWLKLQATQRVKKRRLERKEAQEDGGEEAESDSDDDWVKEMVV